MTSYADNPFRDPKPWHQVKLGGVLLIPILTKVNGIEIEDDWDKPKGTGKSGAEPVFKGTKPLEGMAFTFKATDERDFEGLRDIYEQLAPVPSPGFGLPAPAAASSGSSGSGGSSDAAKPASGFPVDETKKDATAQPNPGPKPPSVSIDNAFTRWVGVTTVARKKITAPEPQDDNSWDMTVTFVKVETPVNAAVGAASPAKPDAAGAGSGTADGGGAKFGSANGGPSDAATDANAKLGQAAAA